MNILFKEDFRNKYEIIEKIGVGNYTDVYKVENKDTKEIRAIKIIKLSDIKLDCVEELDEYIKRYKGEIENMKICGENNENSVKYYESFETENEFAIVLELCDKSLKEFKKNRRLNSKEIYEILNQLNNTFKIMN